MSTNGSTKEDLTLNDTEKRILSEFVNNIVMSRKDLMARFMDPRRDIDQECGYPKAYGVLATDYRDMYDREGTGTRVVEVLPKESWQVPPTVYEEEDSATITPFEQAWDDLGKGLRGDSWYQDEQGSPIWEALKRADILSGIGHYGVILLGLDDGLPMDQPVKGFKPSGKRGPNFTSGQLGRDEQYNRSIFSTNEADPKAIKEAAKDDVTDPTEAPIPEPAKEVKTKRKLLFIRSFDESLAQITKYETDKNNPRFGQPVEYSITLNQPESIDTGLGLTTGTLIVHWSRIIHVADNLGSSEVFGAPRQRPVWNRLLDLRKLYGGSAEMYWRGAFPGLSFETHPQLAGDVIIDHDKVKAAAERYMNTLQRYLVSEGMTVKSIAPQVVDPTAQINTEIQAICIVIGCPQRVFMGSERGELASGQDDTTWNGRLKERQQNYLTPRIIVPFVDRLIMLEVLPEPKGYSVEWPDLDALQPLEEAQLALTKTQSIQAYVAGGCDVIIEPFDFLTRILGFDEEEADAIWEATKEHLAEAVPDADNDPIPGREPVVTPEEPPPGPIKMKGDENLVDPEGTVLIKGKPKPPTRNFDPDQPRDESGRWTAEGVDLSKFGWHEEDDDYLYHITSEPNAKKILAEQALKRGKPMFKSGSYAAYSKGKVFFTERSGVKFWEERVEQHLFDQFDDPPEVAAIRVPRAAVEERLQYDEIGTKDAGLALTHKAWYIDGEIKLADPFTTN